MVLQRKLSLGPGEKPRPGMKGPPPQKKTRGVRGGEDHDRHAEGHSKGGIYDHHHHPSDELEMHVKELEKERKEKRKQGG